MRNALSIIVNEIERWHEIPMPQTTKRKNLIYFVVVEIVEKNDYHCGKIAIEYFELDIRITQQIHENSCVLFWYNDTPILTHFIVHRLT